MCLFLIKRLYTYRISDFLFTYLKSLDKYMMTDKNDYHFETEQLKRLIVFRDFPDIKFICNSNFSFPFQVGLEEMDHSWTVW